MIWPRKLIIRDEATGEPYLTRWHLVRCKWFRIFIHRIHRADKDRHLHNHPWPRAFAIVLRGGYQEMRDRYYSAIQHYGNCSRLNTCGPRINHLYTGTYHRITWVAPNTWTLFIAGRRTRDWGFLVDGKHVPCREYLGLPPDHDFGD